MCQNCIRSAQVPSVGKEHRGGGRHGMAEGLFDDEVDYDHFEDHLTGPDRAGWVA